MKCGFFDCALRGGEKNGQRQRQLHQRQQLRVLAVEEAGQGEGCGCGDASDEGGLDGTAKPTCANELSFEGSEEGQGCKGDDDGELEGFAVARDEHVGEQRDKATGDVRGSDGESGAMGAVGGRFFEAKLEAHHEVDPGGGVVFEGCEDGLSAGAVDAVLLEDLVDLFFFVAGTLDDLALFAMAFGDIVLGVSAGGEVAAETHRDGPGGDLGQTGQHHDAGGRYGSGEAGGEGEGDGEAVGETDDDVADGGGGFKVALYVGAAVVRVEDFVHAGSVVPDGLTEERRKFL